MNPLRVRRDQLSSLTDLPNVGKAVAQDLRDMGFSVPSDLKGIDGDTLFARLEALHGPQDPCMLDTLRSVADFLAGGEPRPWWEFSRSRLHPRGL